MSRLARAAVRNLSASWAEIPHVTHTDWADITTTEELRRRQDSELSLNAVFARALCACLVEYPRFNASIDIEHHELIFRRDVGLGVAVDTSFGLVVPIVHRAQALSASQLDGRLRELADKARAGELGQRDIEGGTFTLTNVGSIGGEFFTPIIRQSEAAILGIGRAKWQDERLQLPLSLSYDHRINNGADAARFVRRFAELVGNPLVLAATGASPGRDG